MIIYNIKGNPYGLKVEICARAAGLSIPVEEASPNGTCAIDVVCIRLFLAINSIKLDISVYVLAENQR